MTEHMDIMVNSPLFLVYVLTLMFLLFICIREIPTTLSLRLLLLLLMELGLGVVLLITP